MPRPGRPAGPAWPSRPTRSCRRSASPSCAIFEEEGVDPARVVIGHADSYPVLDHYLAIIERGANVEFDFLGHELHAAGAPRRAAIVELPRRAGRARPCRPHPAEPGRLPRLPAQALRGQRLRLPAETFLPRLRDAGVTDAQIDTMTVANPRRLLTIAD